MKIFLLSTILLKIESKNKMEALLTIETKRNDLNDQLVVEKWKQCSNDPFTLQIKPEYDLTTYILLIYSFQFIYITDSIIYS